MLGGTAPVMLFNFASISSRSILEKLGIEIGVDSIFDFDIPLFSTNESFDSGRNVTTRVPSLVHFREPLPNLLCAV